MTELEVIQDTLAAHHEAGLGDSRHNQRWWAYRVCSCGKRFEGNSDAATLTQFIAHQSAEGDLALRTWREENRLRLCREVTPSEWFVSHEAKAWLPVDDAEVTR